MRHLIIISIAVLLSGCTASRALIAMHKSTNGFHVLENDPRIRYETGAEANVRIVADSLDQAITVIESLQYGPFKDSVNIYVPATVESFAAFCASSSPGGCVLKERLFISPKEQNTPERIPRVLTHELSHLHMEQRLGMWKWNAHVPSWFREGLAVYASGGSGADTVTEEEAIKALASGKDFIPSEAGSLLFPKSARSYGLQTHMFYRQAGLFVTWLHERSAENFRNLIIDLQSGETFGDAMRKAYGTGIAEQWEIFTAEIKTRNSKGPPEAIPHPTFKIIPQDKHAHSSYS